MKTVRYYDSLKVESESCRLFADLMLVELKKSGLEWLPDAVPARVNAVAQGPLQCGFFVAFWCEEEMREKSGEGRWPSGPPSIVGVRRKMEKFLLNLEPVCMRVHQRMTNLDKAEEEAVKAHDEAAAVAKATGAMDESSKTLAMKAAESMQAGKKGEAVDVEIPADDDLEAWAIGMQELLLEAHQKDVEKVKATGIGSCAKCRWSASGCAKCDWVKAVRYWRRQETKSKHLEGYSDGFKASVKAKAKAKGKAKAKAKAK